MKKQITILTNATAGYAEIFLYGSIGEDYTDDCVTAAEFVQELKQLEKQYSTIKVRINSGGGSVFDGLAMFNALRNSPAKTEAHIDGLAASMAMPVALGCKKVYMSKYSQGMSHRVSGGSYGNADDLKQMIVVMEELENSIADIIAKRTGLTTKQAKDKYLTSVDRWITAQQALQEKLIDGIYDGEKLNTPANASPLELISANNRVLQNRHATTVEPGKVLVQLMEGLYMEFSEPEAEKWELNAEQQKQDEEKKAKEKPTDPGKIDYSKIEPPTGLLLSWEELDKKGMIKDLKENNPEVYAYKYNQKYDKYPTGYILDETAQKFLHNLYIYHMSEEWLKYSYEELHQMDVIWDIKKLNPQLYAWKYYASKGHYPSDIVIDADAIEEYKRKEIEYLKSRTYDNLMHTDGMARLKKLDAKAASAIKPPYNKAFKQYK